MPKKIHNQFTYGFEIEGMFDESIPEKLKYIDSSIEIDEKEDGSVHVPRSLLPDDIDTLYRQDDDWEDDNGDWQDGDTHAIQELAIGVFEEYKDMVNALKVFKHGKTYAYNETCGLHIHIAPKDGQEVLQALLYSHKFIKYMQKWAGANMCQHVKDRLAGNQYCRNYGNLDNTFYDILREEKYRFMGKHPQGTSEFRFFAPCEHMVANVQAFFEELYARLAEQEPTLKKRITLAKAGAPTEAPPIELLHRLQGVGNDNIRITDEMIENDYYFRQYRRVNPWSSRTVHETFDVSQQERAEIEIINNVRDIIK